MYKNYLEQLQFQAFTPIQKESFFAYKSKKSLVGIAPTGTGKTLAYGIPVIDDVKATFQATQVIIILPTTELIKQVHAMLSLLRLQVTIKAITGLDDLSKVGPKLKDNQPHVLISNPSKLRELMFDYQAVNTKFVKHVILDEADMMFDIDFMQDITTIFSRFQQARYYLYSASLKPNMKPFIKRYFGAYTLIDTTKSHQLDITYYLIETHEALRLETLKDVVVSVQPYLGIIFVSSKEALANVQQALEAEGISLPVMSSKETLRKRLQLMKQMRDLKVSWVLSTDVLARGIDLDVSHVIHYDLPKPLSLFMHRSGRTGRMHQSGTVITLYDRKDLANIQKLMRQGVAFKKASIQQGVLVEKQKRLRKTDQPYIIKKKKVKVKPNYKKKLREGRK